MRSYLFSGVENISTKIKKLTFVSLILHKKVNIMSENSDDLEETLMLAAAAADSRQYEESRENLEQPNEFPEEVPHYTENKRESIIISPQNSLKRMLEEPSVSHKRIRTEIELVANVHKGIKRKHEDINESDPQKTPTSEGYSHSLVVATHYNLIQEKGLAERSKSRIIYLKNFHNWIKSMLINEYLTKIKDGKKQHNPPVRVHDMCCGKGGDLLKWKKGAITHLICSDIAEGSLEDCKGRYTDMKQRERGGNNIYSIEYISADSTRVRLREKYSDPSMKLDLLSCQFAFHYSFESLPQAECMIRNASECLIPGGFFIGTMTDANALISRSRKLKTDTFGNDVFKVILYFDTNKPPLFGAKYHFYLDGAVDCPEFIVHFPTLVKLAKKYGLKLVRKEMFYEYFERMKSEGRQLLSNMGGLESYPPNNGATLMGTKENDYDHAKELIKKEGRDNMRIGTMSRSEWEASSLYTTFVFEKVKNTWNADGTPCYDI